MSLNTSSRGASLVDLADWAATLAGGEKPRARVLHVRGDGPSADRLRELGFTRGTEVIFVRRAPLGDPLCFRLRGTELCLRRTEASLVEIEPA